MRGAGVRRALGVVVLVVAVVGAVALWLGAGRRYDDAVDHLAAAPIGCDTTLVFDRTGRYTFFVETKGHIDRIAGDCQSAARDYDVATTPRVALTLVDGEGDAVDLRRTSGPSYDRNGKRGEGIRSVEISDTGSYVLTATSPDTEADAVIRVGRDPARGVAALRGTAIAVLAIGVIAGVLLLVLGRRRTAPIATAPPPPPTFPPLPTRPPLGPPAANPPIPPPYAPRPPSHGQPGPGSQHGVGTTMPAPGRAPGAGPAGGPPDPTLRPPGGWPGRGAAPLPPPPPPSSPPGRDPQGAPPTPDGPRGTPPAPGG